MAHNTATVAVAVAAVASATTTSIAESSTAAQGALGSAGQGYYGDSLSLKIILSFLIGLALYNSIELLVLILVTFNKYQGVYFWSLIVAGVGIIPYSLGFMIKFFQFLNPNENAGYLAVVMLTLGWYAMVTGQSVVLWSRLHLVTNSRRIIKYTLYMIIIDGCVLHATTTVLTFGANANHFSEKVLARFTYGYSVMEKIQMVGFFVQELIISVIYIKETLRLLKLSESVKDDIESVVDVKNFQVRKTMYQLIAINAIIIAMDLVLLGVEFANLYLIQTTLKGVIYSIKLKLEFAVLGRLVQIVRSKNSSGNYASDDRRPTMVAATRNQSDPNGQDWPDFVDPRWVGSDVTHAESSEDRSPGLRLDEAWEGLERERGKKRVRVYRNSWIDEEMDKHNIG
ncbi:hypothetical protein K505DRAFT_397165 [Melanomma pulvis-pyrius CBS 109.77]|uniref:DUF7703 domain-containing protein n=1 Tax=Melanomma pulvis-pyrius CBS 109.77 TaxID=1314802 RepID=A0A6A6XMP7_9PLEO|nr:hypothetical protein K505DRAFT_397165 [Melanomma pulvis-pyrius CBS 109.77]